MRTYETVVDECGQVEPASAPPRMHRVHPWGVIKGLDYADMVALSGMFRRWAIYEEWTTPAQNTRFIEWSADFERLAEWVGPKWRASDPSEKPDILKFVATLERRDSNVIDLDAVRVLLSDVPRS